MPRLPRSFAARWVLISAAITVIGTLVVLVVGLVAGKTGTALISRDFPVGFVVNVAMAIVFGYAGAVASKQKTRRPPTQ